MRTIWKTGALVIAVAFCSEPALAQVGPGAGYGPRGGPGIGYTANRWSGAGAYGRPYAARAYGRGIWAGRAGYNYGGRRALGYGYAARRFGYGGRLYGSYGYRPAVRYAYAETPYAYDIPQETYATGIFGTASTVGLHGYEYAYTTRVRPIAAYAGATGSYAGGYPIYNRPLAPAYPTPGCDCEY